MRWQEQFVAAGIFQGCVCPPSLAVAAVNMLSLEPIDQRHVKPGPTGLTPDDLEALRRAVELLENPSLAARLAAMAGRPIELLGNALPASASQAIAAATGKALEMALKVALRTMRRTPSAAHR